MARLHATSSLTVISSGRSGKTSCTRVVFSGVVPKDTFFGQQTQELEKSKFKYDTGSHDVTLSRVDILWPLFF